MRLAIATGTGPEQWGLPLDFGTIATFELVLAEMREEQR